MSRKSDDQDIASRPFLWRDLYPWQKTSLTRQLALGVPQAILLHGTEGIGKRVYALNAARALLCESPDREGLACGRCSSCEHVASMTHPDLILIDQYRYDAKKNEWLFKDDISVEAIRDMIADMNVASHFGRGRVVVITPAEKMNRAGANALLKTLEEPQQGNVLLLVSHRWQQLPATVMSRCQKWVAPFPAKSDALAYLKSEGLSDAETLLARAGGAPLAAADSANAAWHELHSTWLSQLLEPQRLSPFAAGLDWAGKREEVKDQFAAWLNVLIGFVSDLARVNADVLPRFYPECNERMRQIAPLVEKASLFRYYGSLLRQRRLLGRALTPRLWVEALLMEYRALFFR
ncbi:MAG: hypothetical protein LBG61_01800 [Burkholderiales bacterium]|jgi:DNA polymerase-3 subunit delta'|nr:hypothetical protein [Burkholderiales bacterium]